MAYNPPYIDEAGLHLNTYVDIRTYLENVYRQIYGVDLYLEEDSQDGQLISTVSLFYYDAEQFALYAYNSMSPLTAIGAALSRLVLINGIVRKPATKSIATVTITGTAGTVINVGIIRDANMHLWNLPDIVTIPASGTIDVVATAQEYGEIVAGAGDINTIITPTLGWTGVTNAADATPGQEAESDSELRARQGLSTSYAARTVFEATLAAVQATEGVTNVHGEENPTSVTNALGIEPHTIAIVAEGGTDYDVAYAIFLKKTPGCGTQGTTTVTIPGEFGAGNLDINFSRPTNLTPTIVVNITTLENWTTDYIAFITQAIVDTVAEYEIGQDLFSSFLIGAANGVNGDQRAFYTTSVTINGNQSLSVAYNELVKVAASQVSVVVTQGV